ncbi:unnamed protein product [Caenorhabditis auriculariae]|uniref:Reverse transcriptase domain-containing protein n=1 Tax=Caenorhabditis auriculariae TaxID=2777116 RepID=A0A8S1GSA0_9PELO|nr:unnamed protein product [Caenorhabditis auriculariae]
MRQLGWDTNRDWEDGNVIKGINIDGKILTNLRFADDIVLFANNTSDLSSMLNDLDAWMRNRFCDQGNVTLEGRDLLEVNSYVYLGREVNMTNDLKTRDSKTPTSWMGRTQKLRAHIFEASVIPAISYATEVWPDTKNTTTALRTSYRALERALLGTTRLEQWKKEQTSTDLRQRSQIQDLEEHIQRGKHRWGGHVIRRQDDRWSTRTTHWIPRNIKRPPTRWTDYFRKNISQPGRHWMTVAQDRAAWRTCAECYEILGGNIILRPSYDLLPNKPNRRPSNTLDPPPLNTSDAAENFDFSRLIALALAKAIHEALLCHSTAGLPYVSIFEYASHSGSPIVKVGHANSGFLRGYKTVSEGWTEEERELELYRNDTELKSIHRALMEVQVDFQPEKYYTGKRLEKVQQKLEFGNYCIWSFASPKYKLHVSSACRLLSNEATEQPGRGKLICIYTSLQERDFFGRSYRLPSKRAPRDSQS